MKGVNSWDGRRVVVLGLARQGKALTRFLIDRGAELVVSDLKPADQLRSEIKELSDLQLTYALGGHSIEMLEGAEMLCLSGGVPADLPIVRQARERGLVITNDAQLFLGLSPADVIGVTGSAGKSTTVSLLAEMIKLGFEGKHRQVWLGGNIGFPLIQSLDEMSSDDLAVMELSSFQLEIMTVSPRYAAVLNLLPDHLDRHGDMESYRSAKARILLHQKSGDVALLNYSDPLTWDLKELVQSRLLAFGLELPGDLQGGVIQDDRLLLRMAGDEFEICRDEHVSMPGLHNRLNVLAAGVLAYATDVPVEAIRRVARTFKGVPHRLEHVRSVEGVDWYNDSIATTPDRAIAAVRAFDRPIVLLAGGRDKDLDWHELVEVVHARVRVLIVFGEAAGKIQQAFSRVSNADDHLTIQQADGMDEAVNIAANLARDGDVVLLSPGGTSFDEFDNYEARGERFRSLVEAM